MVSIADIVLPMLTHPERWLLGHWYDGGETVFEDERHLTWGDLFRSLGIPEPSHIWEFDPDAPLVGDIGGLTLTG